MATTQLSGWSFGTNESALSTMRNMSKRVRSCIRSREVIETANEVIRPVRQRDRHAQIAAIADWLVRRFLFVSDPIGVELLRDPAECLRDARVKGVTQGDCDEAAMLVASLGMANGIPARFRALAFTPNGAYQHVICDLLNSDGRWIPVDTTKPQGLVVPQATRTLILGV